MGKREFSDFLNKKDTRRYRIRYAILYGINGQEPRLSRGVIHTNGFIAGNRDLLEEHLRNEFIHNAIAPFDNGLVEILRIDIIENVYTETEEYKNLPMRFSNKNDCEI